MTQELILHRPLVAFDLETTGLDVTTDRIVEISCIKIAVDGTRHACTYRINPGKPIAAAATAVHGIRDIDVAHEPSFDDLALTLLEFLRDCDLTGFNIERFDLPLLSREFKRANLQFPAGPVSIIDSWQIFCRNEPRDLAAAYQFYCGRTLSRAHSAECDAIAAADILLAQVRRYGEMPKEVAPLAQYCHPQKPDWVDPDGKIVWRDEQAVLGFGQHKNRPLKSLAQDNPDYLQWIMKANFSETVVAIAKAALAGEFPQRPAAMMLQEPLRAHQQAED